MVSNDVVKFHSLLSLGVPVDYRDEKSKWSSLHWASAHGNVSIVEALLSSGAAADYLATVESPPPVSSSPCPPQAVARDPPLVPT